MQTPEKPKILLADDADVGRSILRALLRREFDVVEARNGLEAIRALETSDGRIAAVILDVMMPVMDGFRVLQFMRERELIGRVPAIMLTAISDAAAKIRCYEAGATDVIEKPYDEKLIVHKIRALVAAFSARAAAEETGAGALAEGILDALPDAVYASDPATHRITYCNAVFRDLPGVPAEPIGADARSALPEPLARAAVAVWEDLLLRRVRSERFVRLPGDPRVWRLSYNALLDDAGEISDLVGHVSDVTELFRAAPTLAAALLPEKPAEALS